MATLDIALACFACPNLPMTNMTNVTCLFGKLLMPILGWHWVCHLGSTKAGPPGLKHDELLVQV